MNSQVDVSIAMMTYYHEQYVSRAIESVLAQKTNYTYEIIVSDDCSQDRTREILKEYRDRYPDIIKLNFNKNNLGISNNNYQTRLLCTGRYIATLSGDDYWIDINKLQSQVDFLDSHPDYYAVASCIEGRFDNDDEAFAVYPKEKYRGKTIDLKMYLHGAMFGTNGMMMRNAYLTPEGKELFSLVPKASPFIDDATECLLVLMQGKIYVSNTHSVVYRVPKNNKGRHNFNAINTTMQKCQKSINLYNNLYRLMDSHPDFLLLYKDHIAVALAHSLLKRNISEFISVYNEVPEEYRKRGLLIRSIPTMIRLCIEKIKRLV